MKKIILKENRKVILIEKRQRKKKGFTIIEMSVVLSIMVLLMAVFLPTVSGAIEDSKNVGIRGEAQTVVFAWQTINSKTDLNLETSATKGKLVEEANKNADFSKYFNLNKTKSLSGDVTVEQCMQVVEGKKFTIDKDGKITITS
ncbi:MAG: type II secretion system protein [Clostridium sp.]|uniref:type II secretion system protein n=1 Tax=Clostridium sp. TaxID=1506 RepID=UPI003F3E6125